MREPPELLGSERIPRATRMRTTKLNMTSIVKMSVDNDGDFRAGKRECRSFAIADDDGDRRSRNPRNSIGIGDLREFRRLRNVKVTEKRTIHELSFF